MNTVVKVGSQTRKTPYKKTKKAEYAWLEQVFLEIDRLKAEVAKLKKTQKYLSDEIQKIKEGE
jgi:hypothetical protein